ncbi:MAG TPA: xylose isomerase [Chthonomonadales bacterium]|nr:xylose isomerase [Chthonomonadales bacterium]
MGMYTPQKSDRFTFGLWTVTNRGRDPFGEAVRGPMTPVRAVQKLSELGAYGVNLHDNDLVPIDATATERDAIVAEFKRALADHGLCVPMATTNLFYDPVFKDGAFSSSDPRVRAYALRKTMVSMDLGAELGAKVYVFWGGREGAEVDAAKSPVDALRWMRECMDFLCEYNRDKGYGMLFALEAKPNEPRGDIYLPTTGAMLAFIATLAHPEMVGVNPEVAHENMAGLNFPHAVAQALEAGKLFHIDLNAQKPGRFDQDLRFGQEDIKGAFTLVMVLENAGYQGPLHFDAHALRTEDDAGVWDFASGCMRTYLILKEKVARFNADAEIQGIIKGLSADPDGVAPLLSGGYSAEAAARVAALPFDRVAYGRKGYGYERLDQLVTELLLGVR